MDQLKVPRAWVTCANVALAFLALPLIVIVVSSFTNATFISFPPRRFGFDAFLSIASHPDFLHSLWISCLLATLVAVVATAIGLFAAVAIAWSSSRTAVLIQTFLLGPLMIPALVLGLGLLQALSIMGIRPGLEALFIGHLALALPYVTRVVGSQLADYEPDQEKAARGLGAGSVVFFATVLLPALRPALVGGAVFAFVVSFDDVSMAIFLSSSTVITLPVQIYTYVAFSFEPFILALSMLIILATLVIGLILEKTIGLDVVFGTPKKQAATKTVRGRPARATAGV